MANWPSGIRPRGTGFEIRIWRKGKLAHSENIAGDLGKGHLATAIKRRDDLKAKVRVGIAVREDDHEGVPLFCHAAQDYLNRLTAKRSTSLSYKNILNRHWLPLFGRKPVTSITLRDIETHLANIEVSNKTKRNLLMVLSGVLSLAKVRDNPAEDVKILKHQKPRVDRYKPQERDALLAHLEGQTQAYFALLFGTGLRPGEALGLTWADYDGEELDVSKQITRRRREPTTKTSMRRRVFVPQWVRPYLRDLPSRFQGRHLFVNTQGGPYLDTDVFNESWQKAHKKARIPYRIPYTCRHTRAAELMSVGIEPADAARQLGHSVEMFLRTYSEFIEELSPHRDRSRFDTALSPNKHRTEEGKNDASD